MCVVYVCEWVGVGECERESVGVCVFGQGIVRVKNIFVGCRNQLFCHFSFAKIS